MKKLEKTFIQKLIAFIIIGLIGFSCSGKRTPGTTTTLNFAGAFGDANFQDAISGGLIIHGKNKSGPGAFFINVTGAASLTKELPNGDWDFVGIAWDGDKFSGNVSCEVFSKTLSGEDAGVTLIFSPGKCKANSRNVFGLSGDPSFETDGQFTPLKFFTCAGFASDAADHFATGGTELPDDIDCQYEPGRAKSFKLVIPAGEFFDIEVDDAGNPIERRNQPSLESGCIGTSTDGSSSDVINAEYQSTIRFPYIFNAFELKSQIMAFDNHNCTLNGSEEIIDFRGGLGKRIPGYFKGLAKASESITKVYLDSALCEGSGMDNDTFAGQAFDANNTNFICTANQLAYVGSTAATLSGRYKIVGEIDLNGATGFPIPGTFDGEIGGGKLINGTQPLFNALGGARIYEMDFSNFNITISTGSDFGVLAKSIDNSGGGRSDIERLSISNSNIINNGTSGNIGGLIGSAINPQIDIEELSIDGLSINSSQSNSGKVGAVFGHVLSTGSSGQSDTSLSRFEISNVSIDASDSSYIGGLIGQTEFSGTNGNFRQEINIRGGDVNNLQILNGANYIGGVFGLVAGSTSFDASVEIFDLNMANDSTQKIHGNSYVGGLIGSSNHQSRIMRSYITQNLEFHDAASATDDYFGGIAGSLSEAFINDNKVAVNINNTTTIASSFIGGIAGSATDSNIKNNDISINLLGNGSNVGGLIGQTNANSYFMIDQNRVVGNLAVLNNTFASQKRGGVIGQAIGSGSSFVKNIYLDLDIDGESFIGGAVGEVVATHNFELSSSHINANIEATTSNNVGGAAGSFNDTARFNNSIISSIVRVFADTNISSSLVGEVSGSCNDRFVNLLFLGSLNKGSSAPVADSTVFSNVDCSADASANYDIGAGVMAVNTISNNPADNFSTNAIGVAEWNYSGSSTLKFMDSWTKMDNAPISSRPFGVYHDPFYINNVADWNKIGDDIKLMNKSFILGNHLDFNNSFSTPIGSKTFPFVGSFSANYKEIRNAHYDISSTSESTGIFGALGRQSNHALGQDFGMIGNFEDPIIVTNFLINGSSNATSHYGFVGELNDGNVIVRIKNGQISLTGDAGFVGGIVGRAIKGAVVGSEFTGDIDANGSSDVGGLIGAVTHTLPEHYDIRVEESKAKIGLLKSSQKAGGLVGTYSISSSPSGSYLSIRDSYVEILDKFQVDNASAMVGGFVGRYHDDNLNSGSIEIEKSYVNMEGSNGFTTGASPIKDAFFSVGGGQGSDYNLNDVHFIRETAQAINTTLSGSFYLHNNFDNFITSIDGNYDWDVGYEWKIQSDTANGGKQSLTLWWENFDVRCFDETFSQNNQNICFMD